MIRYTFYYDLYVDCFAFYGQLRYYKQNKKQTRAK